ncbi:unnamed protein product [Dimorphilus gyrociliatus]|uniref:Uncharacterized protein n=1 Tax=Dimorphilus gyrociliatus TaxID=2664684 RepID=A0A7I8VRI4_9ANNE|nr:unnamed protein product [Dimorphilus gyrociliatus]
MFDVRIVYMDYYLTSPIPDYDPIVRELDDCIVHNIPVLRIFGSTATGEKVCAHIHGVLPYLFVIAPNMEDDEELIKYGRLLAYSVEKALNLSSASKQENSEKVHSVQTVRAFRMYGYSGEENVFFKLFLYDPADLKRVSTLLLEGAILNTVFQPHQVHVPYNLQFLIDYNLRGMDYLKAKRAKKREDANRQSYCQLEVDIIATDITNADESSLNGRNPALEYIWKEEGKTKPSLSRTPSIQSKYEYDTDGLQRLNEVVERFRGDASIQSTPDATALEVGDEPVVSRETIERLSSTQLQKAKEGKEILLRKAKSGDAEAFKQLDAQDMFQLEEGDSILLAHNEDEEEDESIDEKTHVKREDEREEDEEDEENDEVEKDISNTTIPQLDGVSDMDEKSENNIEKFSSNLASLKLKTSSNSHVFLDLRPNKSQLALAKRSGSKRDDGAICEHVELLEESDDDEKIELGPKPLMVDLRVPQTIASTGTRVDLRNLCRLSPLMTALTAEKLRKKNKKIKESSPILESLKRKNRFRIQYGRNKNIRLTANDRNEIDANIDDNQITPTVCMSDGEADYFCSKSTAQEKRNLKDTLKTQVVFANISTKRCKSFNRMRHSRFMPKKTLLRRRLQEHKLRKLKLLKRKKTRKVQTAKELPEPELEPEPESIKDGQKNDIEEENDKIDSEKVDWDEYNQLEKSPNNTRDQEATTESSHTEEIPPLVPADKIDENLLNSSQASEKLNIPEIREILAEADSTENTKESQGERYGDKVGNDHATDYADVGMKLALLSPAKEERQGIWALSPASPNMVNGGGQKDNTYSSPNPPQNVQSATPPNDHMMENNLMTVDCNEEKAEVLNLSIHDKKEEEERQDQAINNTFLIPEFNFCHNDNMNKQSSCDLSVTSSIQAPPIDLLKMAVEAANINNNADEEDCIITENHYRPAPIMQQNMIQGSCNMAKMIEIQNQQAAQQAKRRQQQQLAVHQRQQEQYRMQQYEREKHFQQYQHQSHHQIPQQQQRYYSSYAAIPQQSYIEHQQSTYDPNANAYRAQSMSYTTQYSHMYPSTGTFNYSPYTSHLSNTGQNDSYSTFSDAGHGMYRQHQRYPQS